MSAAAPNAMAPDFKEPLTAWRSDHPQHAVTGAWQEQAVTAASAPT